MLIAGEKIHILNPVVHRAIEAEDINPIVELAVKQVEAGAHALDINLGPGKKAGGLLPDIIQAVQEETEAVFMFPADNIAFTRAMKVCRQQAVINAATADTSNLKRVLSAAKCFNARVVVLLTRRGELPSTVDQWCLMAEEVIETAEDEKFPVENLYLDPVMRTRFNPNAPGTFTSAMELGPVLEAISLMGQLREQDIRTICGLSNISLHLPGDSRSPLHCSALRLLKAAGLSAVILNPLDQKLMAVANSAPLHEHGMNCYEKGGIVSEVTFQGK